MEGMKKKTYNSQEGLPFSEPRFENGISHI
jgi:hypothetical protein